MPRKSQWPTLPYLDPEFTPDHPANNPPRIPQDKYLPMGKRELQRLERSALDEAIQRWTPPHVPRLWEVDSHRAAIRQKIFSLYLSPKLPEYSDLIPEKSHDSSASRRGPVSPDPTDFRDFAHKSLSLGFYRFHASHGDPNLPSEEVSMQQYGPDDPAHDAFPPEDICWIMEYSNNECNVIRRKLAQAMGEFPAVIDEESPLYDPEIAWRYEHRLYCRCRRRNKQCIRPSHIEIFTSSFDVLP